jgi:N4-(beta-N-acetylglucosaminyl)-L-asparaginase
MREGKDTVEAAVEGVSIVEDDPNDMSVGFGGLPNEAGVVQLDASVMHGPTMRAGAVACIENIKNPSRVARAVMQRTDHVLLVGSGALAFAKAVGFEETNLLTERARRAWLNWKSRLSKDDDWLDDEEIAADFGRVEDRHPDARAHRPTGTISCIALNAKGELGGCTTTSGLAYKIPGRVGDSPIIGAGLYVDGEVGGCGSTGRGEAVLQSCGTRTVVENMRRGLTPQDAVLDVLKRICDQTKSPRLLHPSGRPNFDVNFYAISKDGSFAGGRIYRGGRFAAHDGSENRTVEMAYLYESA